MNGINPFTSNIHLDGMHIHNDERLSQNGFMVGEEDHGASEDIKSPEGPVSSKLEKAAQQLKAAEQLTAAGYSFRELIDAGYSSSMLEAAGWAGPCSEMAVDSDIYSRSWRLAIANMLNVPSS